MAPTRRLLFPALSAGVLALGACALRPAEPGRRFVVFFQPWSAALGEEAHAAVDGAASFARQHPALPVTVTGFASPVGAPQANKDLSEARALAVADTLVRDGLDPARLRRRSEGAVAYVDDTLEARRVEITVGTP